jgi:hypothetical protein
MVFTAVGLRQEGDPKEASSQAARFFVDFRKRFDKAPIEEKKALLRQVVLGVSVNPVERLPAVQ